VYGRSVEVIDKFSYLGLPLENTGGWKKQKAMLKSKVNETFIVIDKC
jgi:hypothetical protein